MNKKMLGLVVATAVAGLVMTGGIAKAEEAAAGKVKCEGINACKGQGACGGADHDCKGKNTCKGKGWVEVASEKECTDKGGKVVAEKK
jgi:hypothetical protein